VLLYLSPGSERMNLPSKGSIAVALAALTILGVFCNRAAADDAKKKDEDSGRQEKIYELTNDITPPRLIHRVNPTYSPGSKGVRLEGSVYLEMVITSRGEPGAVRVVKSLAEDVDRAALDAVKQWRFDPARKDGKPVAVRVTVEVAFHAM